MKKKAEILKQKQRFLGWYEGINVGYTNIGSESSEGKALNNCENVKNAFFTRNTKNGNNLLLVDGTPSSSEIYDTISIGLDCHDFYGVNLGGTNCSNIYFSNNIGSCTNIYYSDYLDSCSYCLGCVGLKNKQFCILNKQYTKEEWHIKVNEIFTKMEKDGHLGKFFPPSMNPFYFNDTVAYLIDDSFTKEEVTAAGYLRRDEEIKVDIPEGSDIVYTNKKCLLLKGGAEGGGLLNDYQGYDAEGNRRINPEILKKVIVDAKGNSYRIIKMEYDFLVKYGLPLPELHWLDRIKLGFSFEQK